MNRGTSKKYSDIWLLLGKLLHFLLTVLAFSGCLCFVREDSLGLTADFWQENWYFVLSFAAVFWFLLRTYNAYLLGFTRRRVLLLELFLAQLIPSMLLLLVSLLLGDGPRCFAYFLLLAAFLLLDLVFTLAGTKLYRLWNPLKKALLLYRREADLLRISELDSNPFRQLYRMEDKIRIEGESFPELEKKLADYEAVFVAGIDSSLRNGIAKYCAEHNIAGFFLPHLGDILLQGAQHIPSIMQPVMYLSRKHERPEYLLIKRLFDIMVSLLGILLTLPVMLILALCIKLEDGGRVFYRQTRLTKNGREFSICKFRSMRENAEADGKAVLAAKEDSRITRVGAIMRRFRLDELPQLFNILQGDMTIVGPRPERPELAEEIYRSLPEFKLRLQVKAGLTGYAQVYGKYSTENYEKLEFDLLYINRMSILTDLKIMAATVVILFRKESSEGTGPEAETHFTETAEERRPE